VSDPNTTLNELDATLRRLLALLEGSEDPDTEALDRHFREATQAVERLQEAGKVVAADASLRKRVEEVQHLYGAALTLAGRQRDAVSMRIAGVGAARKVIEGRRPTAESGRYCDMQG
jgi:hypothetical protein